MATELKDVSSTGVVELIFRAVFMECMNAGLLFLLASSPPAALVGELRRRCRFQMRAFLQCRRENYTQLKVDLWSSIRRFCCSSFSNICVEVYATDG